jgi:hypothetical protein
VHLPRQFSSHMTGRPKGKQPQERQPCAAARRDAGPTASGMGCRLISSDQTLNYGRNNSPINSLEKYPGFSYIPE